MIVAAVVAASSGQTGGFTNALFSDLPSHRAVGVGLLELAGTPSGSRRIVFGSGNRERGVSRSGPRADGTMLSPVDCMSQVACRALLA